MFRLSGEMENKVESGSGRGRGQLGSLQGSPGNGKEKRMGPDGRGLEGQVGKLASELALLFRDLATVRCHGDWPPGSFIVNKLVN